MEKICRKCNTQNPSNAKFCRRCGERFGDWKSPVTKPKVVYKDRRVEVYKTPGWTIALISVLILISVSLLWYSYKLEDENYSGRKIISQVIGNSDYLKINGLDSIPPLIFVANDLGQYINVASNPDYHLDKLPSWCLVQDSTATGFRIKPFTNKGSLRFDTCYLVASDQHKIAIPIYQKALCEANIKSVSTRKNVIDSSGQLGIEFLLHITTSNMKDNPGLCSIYFSDSNYRPIITEDSTYAAPNGQLVVSEKFRPKYSTSVYNSFRIFLPYTAIEHFGLNHKILFHAVIWDKSFGYYLPIADTRYYTLNIDS